MFVCKSVKTQLSAQFLSWELWKFDTGCDFLVSFAKVRCFSEQIDREKLSGSKM